MAAYVDWQTTSQRKGIVFDGMGRVEDANEKKWHAFCRGHIAMTVKQDHTHTKTCTINTTFFQPRPYRTKNIQISSLHLGQNYFYPIQQTKKKNIIDQAEVCMEWKHTQKKIGPVNFFFFLFFYWLKIRSLTKIYLLVTLDFIKY
jgi:hypothetical protein